MPTFKYLTFAAFLKIALIVVHCEEPCPLLIIREGPESTLWGGNERFLCKVDPKILASNDRIRGPYWKFQGEWFTGDKQFAVEEGANLLTLVKILGPNFGIYECWVRINGRRCKSSIELSDRIGNVGDVTVSMGRDRTTRRPR